MGKNLAQGNRLARREKGEKQLMFPGMEAFCLSKKAARF
jgi:hypothetical protein